MHPASRKQPAGAFGLCLVLVLATAPTARASDTPSANVEQEVAQAAEAIRNYSADKRDQAVREVKSALAAIDDRVRALEQRLEEKSSEMSVTAREQTRSALADLREKRQAVAEWYGGIKHGSRSAWEHVKEGFADAYRSLVDSMNRAEQEF